MSDQWNMKALKETTLLRDTDIIYATFENEVRTYDFVTLQRSDLSIRGGEQ